MEVLSLFNFKPLKTIYENSIFKIYKVEKEDGTIAVVKKITLPISDDDAVKLMESGKILFLQDATNYYLQQMNKEIEILKKLNNEKNILHYQDKYEETIDGKTSYYIIMEYAEDCSSYFQREGVSESDVIKLGIDICRALEACQKNNIYHNDIKPANLFYNGEEYKLGDFGNSTQGSDNNIINFGSMNYISPEVYERKPTTSTSDIYSLGIVMYQLLTNHLPFTTTEESEEKALEKRMSGIAIPPIDTSNKELANIVLKACSYDINNRYQSVSELKKDLEQIVNPSTEKKKITFIKTKMNDTISVFDKSLIEKQDKKMQEIYIQQRKNKKMSSIKKMLKKGLLIALLLILIGVSSFIYAYNRECEPGYINKNGICTKGYYYCDTGYSLNEKNQCQKTIKSIDAKVTYSCPNGYTYTNDTCVSNEIQEPTFTYQCIDGFTLNGKKCEKTESNDAVETYTCPKGYANMNGICVKGDEKDATAKYSCPSGYTKGPFKENGTYKCSKYVTSSSSIDATPKYSCSRGTLNSNNKCVVVTNNVSKSSCNGVTSNEKCTTTGGTWCEYYPYTAGCTKTCTYTCTVTSEPNVTYSCTNGGTLSGTKCNFSGGNTIKVNADVTYSCPSGYERIGSKCIYGKQINGTKVYTCLDSQTLVGNKCYTTITTDAVGMYTCPEGFIASGVTCIQNDFPQPVKKYTCSRIYTLNGDKCEEYETKPAKAEYTK